MKLEDQKEISLYDSFIFALFSGNWFPLAIIIFCVLSIPYIFVGCIWFICLQLRIFGSDGWEEWDKWYIYSPLIALLYVFIWPVALCLSPLCLIAGLFDPCLVIPEDYPQKRWFVALSYLVTPIMIISAALITALPGILKTGLSM